MTTVVIRIPIVADSGQDDMSLAPMSGKPLDVRIMEECDVRHPAGFLLQGMTAVGDQLILVFQHSNHNLS